MTSFIRVPPDSTGKRIRHRTLTDLYVGTEANIPELDTMVYGSISGASGRIIGRTIYEAEIEYFIKGTTGSFQIGDLLASQPNGAGITYAWVIHLVPDVYQAQTILTDAANPDHALQIDQQGQARVRFAEGSPSMDAFGNLRTARAHIIGGYEYSNSDQAGLFQDKTTVGGSIEWVPAKSITTLSVTSSANAAVSRTTNRYHFYQPGVGNLAILTLAHSNSGVANNLRRWGYYEEPTTDVFNGLFYELDGTTLNVVMSSNDVDIGTHRVARANWNGDRLDGRGPSGMSLDLTMANLFWIDYAWLGVGVARFGIVAPDGARYTCHTFNNPNQHTGPYMTSGSLPIRYENKNKSSAPVSGSDMKVICAAVYSESETDYVFWRYADIEATGVDVSDGNDHLVFNMRPKLEVSPGKVNRTGIYPDHLDVHVTGGSARLTILDGAVVNTPTWHDATSLAQYDTVGTITGGEKFRTYYVGPGVTRLNLSDCYETNDEGYHTLADASDAYVFTLVAKKLDGTTVTVSATLGYRELN